MEKNTKKQKIRLSLPDIDSPRLRDFFLGFLIALFLLYDILFFMLGRSMQREDYGLRSGASPVLFENKEYKNLVSGHPIERMIPYISRQNGQVASFIIAIAKKESDWGKYAPQKNGRDCYNYWGYRGSYNQTDSGYSCFDSPRQAVAVIGSRIEDLIAQDIDTPKEMIVWKCGSNCRGHSRYDVRKWISDVDLYVAKVDNGNS
ncbi:MAG: glucosaminidase domain-containing protein [Candidatus Moranbacteria bacterium]|nr:glucosaminidase domain-containing protein [Candidatus Moranbacteria bacterium]